MLYEFLILCVKGIYVIYLCCIIFVLNKLKVMCIIVSKFIGFINYRWLKKKNFEYDIVWYFNLMFVVICLIYIKKNESI